MRGGWHGVRIRRRLGLLVCGGTLVALAAVLRLWWRDAATAGVLVSAIGAFVSVVALVADVLRGDPGPTARSADEQRRLAADALADAVREQWSAEARLRRLQDPAPLDVLWRPADRWLADHPENVRRGARLPAPRDCRVEDPGDCRVEEMAGSFAALPGRRLVVLGGPGSGKSVLAMRFVLGRLAARRPGGPVPVLFPAAGWDPARTGLRAWLADRLAADYPPLAAPAQQARCTLARALLDAGLVLPVLDGFDELARPCYGEAVRALNAELDDGLPLLLTSRGEAWEAAVSEGDVLTAAEVVELLPLGLGQAGAHLARTARPLRSADGSPVTAWTPVLRRLDDRPGHPLARALTTPLMVSLARTVYGDTSRDPAELLDETRFPSPDAVEEHLLGAFVPAAYGSAGAEAAEGAVRRLTLLARGLHGRGRGRLAWWELDALLPRALGVYAPGLLSLALLSALLLPVTLVGAVTELAGTESLLAVLASLAGQTVGFAFGVACLLPADETRPGPRALLRLTGLTAAVSVPLWACFAWADDLRFGFRFGGVTDGWLPDLLGGCLFSLLFTLFFGIAGLPRRPVPLGLPWNGGAGRAVARVFGGALLVGGVGAVLVGRTGNPWVVIIGTTCAVAGGALSLSGVLRAGPDTVRASRAGHIARRFAAGLVRGTAASLLVGVTACTTAGLAAVAVTAVKARPAADLDGRWSDGWHFAAHDGVRTAVTVRPLRGTLLLPGGSARPVAYPEGTRPPDCTLPLLHDRRCVGFVARRTEFVAREGGVAVRLTVPLSGGGAGVGPRPETGPKAGAESGADTHVTVAYAANLRSVLPGAARAWLTQGPVTAVAARCLPPFVAAGVLIGVVGGCVCGVYRALSVPSDVMRAADPGGSLRTDRTASLVRSGLVALIAAAVSVPVLAVPGDWGGLVHVGTQLWLPLGTAALSLSAWGRFAVARVWLAATGRMPWRLMAFLEDAHRRGVLRRSGAYFEFRHLRLQAHLADRGTDDGTHPSVPRQAAASRVGTRRSQR
ncbi:NACHT domain-containing protein [Streptomyces sp. SID13726]|uniref:NACHT domain-containing protein n=1 Tax=Streptomyces sp. SID13726 TaxID=2706058 RepID=UPI0013BD228A|nr:NACHT domain-containing protein [Streptomyces sp. SID13726]NEB02272.1 NACHT domain-containing protein [Streptomyces sp. SID13726]